MNTRHSNNSIRILCYFLILMCAGIVITIFTSRTMYPDGLDAENRLWKCLFEPQNGIVTKMYYGFLAFLKEQCRKHMMNCRPDGY